MKNNNNTEFGKFETPNGKTVTDLRIKAKVIKQSSIEGEFIRMGLGSQKYNKKLKREKMTSYVSLRTYQKIEDGKSVNIKYIKYVAILFTKLFAEQGISRHVNVIDLIKGSKSSNPNVVNAYLNKVNSVDELLGIIKISPTIYKKTFFNCKITENVAKNINNILDIIKTTINSAQSKYIIDNSEIEDEKDFFIDRETLKTASLVNDSLNTLKNNNICLYVGVLKEVPIINAEEFVNVLNKENYDPYNPTPSHKAEFETISLIEKRDYLILNFTNCNNGSSIDLNYHMNWNYNQLNNFIKKYPFKEKRIENVLEDDAEYGGLLSNHNRAVSNAKKYYSSKDKSIILPWSLEKNNFKFNSSIDDEKIIFENQDEFLEAVEAEKQAEAEDLAAEAMSDMLRGKWFLELRP